MALESRLQTHGSIQYSWVYLFVTKREIVAGRHTAFICERTDEWARGTIFHIGHQVAL